jgi:hypothetical protein
VSVNSSAGPSNISFESETPSALSAASSAAFAAGNASATSFAIPGFCDPCPGNNNTACMDQKRTIIEPQVKPAPNATSITFIPSLIRPDSIASSSAMGTEALDVLP